MSTASTICFHRPRTPFRCSSTAQLRVSRKGLTCVYFSALACCNYSQGFSSRWHCYGAGVGEFESPQRLVNTESTSIDACHRQGYERSNLSKICATQSYSGACLHGKRGRSSSRAWAFTAGRISAHESHSSTYEMFVPLPSPG
jgi:hypothetical protein